MTTERETTGPLMAEMTPLEVATYAVWYARKVKGPAQTVATALLEEFPYLREPLEADAERAARAPEGVGLSDADFDALDGLVTQSQHPFERRVELHGVLRSLRAARAEPGLREDVLAWVFALYEGVPTTLAYPGQPQVIVLGTAAEAAAHVAKRYAKLDDGSVRGASMTGCGATAVHRHPRWGDE
jgi:hypothetical protein